MHHEYKLAAPFFGPSTFYLTSGRFAHALFACRTQLDATNREAFNSGSSTSYRKKPAQGPIDSTNVEPHFTSR